MNGGRAGIYDGLVQMGRDLVGSGFFGRTFDVLRLRPTTPASGILDDTPLTSIDAKLDRVAKKDVEDQIFDILAFAIKGDTSALLIGDMLRLRAGEYHADVKVACFAQREPMEPSIALRCDALVTVHRPVDVANRVDDPTPDDWSYKKGTIAGDSFATEDVLGLVAGAYLWRPAGGVAAVVPFGLQPTSRARPGRFTGSPTDTPVERFVGYAPPCPGVFFRDNDVFVMQRDPGASYVAEQVYSSELTGIAGTIMLLSKQGV